MRTGLHTIAADAPPLIRTPSFGDFARRAKAGEKLTVAFFGGSLTWGARASDPQRTSYRARVGRQLEATYPQAHFRYVDAAIGGTGSQLAAFRLHRDVLTHHPDLVFLDFTLNDDVYLTSPNTLAAHESLIRRIILEGQCPVVQLFLAARDYVTDGSTEKMKRRTAHLAIAKAYGVPVGDAIILMQDRWRQGQLDLDSIWPPNTFDMCHPSDPGYALYAEAAWDAFQRAVEEQVICQAPDTMINDDSYMRWARIRLSSLMPLPAGWRVMRPKSDALAHDLYMPRWLDDVTVASNYVEIDRVTTRARAPAKPLTLRFRGTSALLFGESTPRSGCCLIRVDDQVSEFDACQLGRQGNGRLWKLIAEDLDPHVDHILEIQPLFSDSETPRELRLESICVAGGEATVWLTDPEHHDRA